jgi:transcriptional regulator with XRE-family HTH domain
MEADLGTVQGRLIAARKSAGLSQKELAARFPMGASTLSGYETGRFELTLAVVEFYERETGQPLEWLVRGDEQAKARADAGAILARLASGQSVDDYGMPLGETDAFADFSADAALLHVHQVTADELEALRVTRIVGNLPADRFGVLKYLDLWREWQRQDSGK